MLVKTFCFLIFIFTSHHAVGEEDVASVIAERNQQWSDSFNAGDVESLSAIFGKDFIVLPPGSKAIVDRTALNKSLTADMSVLKDMKLETTTVKVVNEYAYEIGKAKYLVLDKDKTWMASEDDYLIVWRKDDGVWNYYVDVWWPSD